MANILSAAAAQLGPPITQGNVTAESAFPSVAGGSLRFTTGAPPIADGRVFRLRCAARVTGGTTTSYTLKVYWWSTTQNNTDLTTFTNDINIISSGALNFNTVTGMLLLESTLVWDSTSQKLDGSFNIFNTGTTRAYTAQAINTNQATGVVAASNIRFYATGIFSGTNANNVATLYDFSVDLL